ncbi:MAG: hypothetical protein AAGE99_02915 [Chlamydiota bacterium]
MKKISVLAITTLSLFGLNLYADSQQELVAPTGDQAKKEVSSDTATQATLHDREEDAAGSFIATKENEAMAEKNRLFPSKKGEEKIDER